MNTTIEITIDALIHQWQQCRKQVAQAKAEQVVVEKALWHQLRQSHLGIFEELEHKLADFIQDEPDNDDSIPFTLLISHKTHNQNGAPAKMS